MTKDGVGIANFVLAHLFITRGLEINSLVVFFFGFFFLALGALFYGRKP